MKKKIYSFMKKNIILIFFFALILIAIGNFFHMVKYSDKNYTFYEREDRKIGTNVVLLPFQINTKEITQEFIAKENNLSRIDIYINNVDNPEASYLNANMTIGIKDDSDNIICEHNYSVLHFYNSKEVSFTFPKIKDSKNKKYTLYIKRINDMPSNVIFGMDVDITGNDKSILGTLTVDGNKYDGSLYMTPMYELNTNTIKTIIIISIVSILTFISICLLNKNKKINIEQNYFIIAIILCLASIFLTPLFYGKDESSHWARAYEISEGNMLSGIKDGWPTSTFSKSLFDVNSSNNFTSSWNKLNIRYSDEETTEVDMQYMSVYSPVSYLPSSTGIFISKLLTTRPAIWAYYARLTNMLVCVSLVYLAIKLLPTGKKLLFTIGLLPSTIGSFSTITADGFLLATTTLLFTYILNIILTKNRNLSKKDYIILIILASIISLSKLVYLPFLLLLLLLINKKDSTSKKVKILGIIIGGFILNMLWGSIAFEYLSIGQGLNSKYYIVDILTHPFQFIQKFIFTWYLNFGKYMNDLFGGNNAWYGHVIKDASIVPIIFVIISLVLSIFDKECHLELKTVPKVIISIIMLLLIALISTSLYISCTPIGFSYFVGIQGRYFLPLLLPILLILGSFIKIKKTNINTNFILSLVIYTSFLSVLYNIFVYL